MTKDYVKLPAKIRDQAAEVKRHQGRKTLAGEFKKLRALVDEMERLMKEDK